MLGDRWDGMYCDMTFFGGGRGEGGGGRMR